MLEVEQLGVQHPQPDHVSVELLKVKERVLIDHHHRQ